MKIIKSIILLLFFSITSWSSTEGIYSVDNRRYVCQTERDSVYSSDEYMKLARSICLLVPKWRVEELWGTGAGVPVDYPSGGINLHLFGKLQEYILHGYGEDSTKYSVSNTIKFYNDLVVGCQDIGTGVMIGDRQILTVDHIFESADPSDYVAIFNWTATNADMYKNVNFEPYYFFRIIGYDTYDGDTLKQIRLSGKTDKMDLSILKTDRIMDKDSGNIPPLTIYNSSNVKEDLVGKELFMIGHCMGLPQVLTDDAYVNANISFKMAKQMGISNLVDHTQMLTQNQFDRLSFANLDGFVGNSGSPIFVKDRKFGWNVVGIYTGGADDYYLDTMTNIVKEYIYTKDDYKNVKKFEHFQTLEGFPSFKLHCDNDCDYIHVAEKSIINKLVKGEWIKVTLPNNLSITNGVYFVMFNNFSGRRVVYYNGKPTPSIVKGFVSNGANYNVKLINPKTQEVFYNFSKSGTAHGNTTETGNVFSVSPTDDGLLTDRLNFVPNINVGEGPLVVNFNAYIPNCDSVVSCVWDFGDGVTSNLMYPCHVYTTSGLYTVKLIVQYSNYTDSLIYNDCVNILDSKDLLFINGDIKKYPIFGVKSVKLNDRVWCEDVNHIPQPVACSNGWIEAGCQSICGSLICRGSVWLRDYSKIYGDIKTSGNITYQNNVSITGDTLKNSIIPITELPLSLPSMKDLVYSSLEILSDVFIEPGNVCEISPGKYYNYTIKSNAKLKLTSGVYYFNKINLDINSFLELDEQYGPIKIYIKSNFDMKGKLIHSLPGVEGPRNFLIGFCGARTIFLDYGFSGTFIAPNSELVLGQVSKQYEGCFYANHIEVHQETLVKYIPFAY